MENDEWLPTVLSACGIAFLVFAWIWVFRWGVPLVKSLHNF